MEKAGGAVARDEGRMFNFMGQETEKGSEKKTGETSKSILQIHKLMKGVPLS